MRYALARRRRRRRQAQRERIHAAARRVLFAIHRFVGQLVPDPRQPPPPRMIVVGAPSVEATLVPLHPPPGPIVL